MLALLAECRLVLENVDKSCLETSKPYLLTEYNIRECNLRSKNSAERELAEQDLDDLESSTLACAEHKHDYYITSLRKNTIAFYDAVDERDVKRLYSAHTPIFSEEFVWLAWKCGGRVCGSCKRS